MDELVEQALTDFKEASEAEETNRTEALEDLKFANGDQWPDLQRKQRTQDGRPCLVFDRISPVIKQITNEQRQQKPAITVSPVGDGADQDTAEIIQGLIRHIEYQSNADGAYDSAFDFAVTTGGPGWIRIITDYCDPKSFDQDIYIKRVRNNFSVYADPSCQEADYSDARYMFVVEDLTKDQFKAAYPKSELTSLYDFGSVGSTKPDWINKESVRIAEYWYIEKKKKWLVKAADGSAAVVDEKPEDGTDARETEIRAVKMIKTNGLEVLEENDWAGDYIPLVPVLGDEVIIDGTRYLYGIVRKAKDPCRNYNYQVSSQIEAIALAPRAPYIGTKKQFEDYEQLWATSNRSPTAFLPYNVDQNAPGPPVRQPFEPAIQAITMAIAQADNDIKAITGLYAESLGEPVPQQSGTAIMARQQQGSTANLHYSDNLGRALKHVGRILVNLIPRIYDTQRVIRIIGEDEQQKEVMIGDPQAQQDWQVGMKQVYDLSAGRYDVTVSMGPSYASKRQEAVQTLMQLIQAFPPAAQIAGPTLLENMDIPGAKNLAKMAQKLLPPQLQEGADAPPSPQMQAMAQQHQQLQQALQQANQIIQSKKLELDSKERIASMQTWAQLAMAESKVNAQATMQMIAQEKEKLMQLQGMQADAASQLHDSAHEAAMQQQQHQFQANQAQQAAAQQQQGSNDNNQNGN
jgi:hypothetical protein